MRTCRATLLACLLIAASSCSVQSDDPTSTKSTPSTEDPMTTETDDPTETRATNPGETLDQLAAEAPRFVLGEVTSVSLDGEDLPQGEGHPAQVAEVTVESVLVGDPATTLVVHKPAGTPYFLAVPGTDGVQARSRGWFALGAGREPDLIGYQAVVPEKLGRSLARAVAGRPAEDPFPTEAELADLVARADVVVTGRATAVLADGERSGTRARLEVNEVLLGTPPGTSFEVERAELPDEVGGPWKFWEDDTVSGPFALDLSGPVPVVLNPIPPTAYSTSKVKAAIKAR